MKNKPTMRKSLHCICKEREMCISAAHLKARFRASLVETHRTRVAVTISCAATLGQIRDITITATLPPPLSGTGFFNHWSARA